MSETKKPIKTLRLERETVKKLGAKTGVRTGIAVLGSASQSIIYQPPPGSYGTVASVQSSSGRVGSAGGSIEPGP